MQSAVAEPSFVKSRERNDLSALAKRQLECHPHFSGRMSGVTFEHEGRNLYLRGQLPTFYLKQLIQEAVRHLPGVDFVYNEIDVINPGGVSSVRY
jgi:osmotically-inducible protein OsmY